MKNFICFLFCSFLMLFASANVQASISEPIPSKSDVSMVDVDLTTVQNDVVKVVSIDCMIAPTPQSILMIPESPAMQGKSVTIPKCPFRYIYKSKYCTHYSYTAYSKLITPY